MNLKTARLRVLIADDSAPVRQRIVSLFEELPRVRVIGETRNVPDTIAEIDRLRPQLVILDMNMPGGSGLDVLDFIRLNRIPSVVVVLSGESDPEYKIRASRAGAIAFLNKSRDLPRLVDIVRELAELTARPIKRRPFKYLFSSDLSYCH